MQKNSSISFNILGSKHFHLWQCFFDIVLFSENNKCTWPLRIRFSIVILCLWVLERCPSELFKEWHRQTPKTVVWTHRLAITPRPKMPIFSHRKRWIVLTGLKHHTIIGKRRFQHLISFISCSSVVHGSHTKSDIQMHLGQVSKWQKILGSNIFYHFLFAVSLGNWAPKMSKQFRLDRKIGFQITFYTKSINVIIDSIGPSIILRSIYLINNKLAPNR